MFTETDCKCADCIKSRKMSEILDRLNKVNTDHELKELEKEFNELNKKDY